MNAPLENDLAPTLAMPSRPVSIALITMRSSPKWSVRNLPRRSTPVSVAPCILVSSALVPRRTRGCGTEKPSSDRSTRAAEKASARMSMSGSSGIGGPLQLLDERRGCAHARI